MVSESTIVLQRLRLRAALRQARQHRGWTQQTAAEQVGWSKAKIVRIELGSMGMSRADLRALASAYGVTDADRIAQWERWVSASRRQPLEPFSDVLRRGFMEYVALEGVAVRIRQFHPMVVPGLLQTRRYAEYLIDTLAAKDTPREARDRQLAARLARQQILHTPHPPRIQILVDESVLHREATDPAILPEQLEHLYELARLPHMDMRVIPATRGLHQAVTGPFTIVDLPDDLIGGSWVYIEGAHAKTALQDDAADVGHYTDVFTRLHDHGIALEETGAAP